MERDYLQIQEDKIGLLTEIGFTKTQAKVYMALIKNGKTNAKTLSQNMNIKRQEIYRTLTELQKVGFVEKTFSNPIEFEAIPVKDAIELILNLKAEEYSKTLEKSKKILKELKDTDIIQKKKEYSISIVEGKDTIIKKCRTAHINCVSSVCVCSTFQRWIQMGREIHENIQNNLTRGIEYHIAVEIPNGEILIPEEVKSLLKHRNYVVKIHNNPMEVNAVIFDGALTGFSLYTSKSIGETPMIWTNQPSIIAGFQEYFKKIWNSAKKLSANKKLTNELVFYIQNETMNYSHNSV